MHDWLKSWVVRLLKIPPEPHPPAGSPESIQIFRASRNYYRYRLLQWAIKQVGAVLGILVFLIFVGAWQPKIPWESLPLPEKATDALKALIEEDGGSEGESQTSKIFVFLEVVGIGVLLAQIPFSYVTVRLDYEMRWYILTDRSLRIREGVNRVREMTMTFDNIQNLAIEQGPVQRLLGISDLRVRTAGGGSKAETSKGEGEEDVSKSMHVGYFRGVDDAAGIRDVILRRLRRLGGAGLGDPDDEEGDAPPSETESAVRESLNAARSLLEEARALRRAVDR